MKRREYHQRIDEIEKKYEALFIVYGRWIDTANKATHAAGLPNFKERNNLPVYQKGQGLHNAIGILHFAPTYALAVERLREAVAEPSCPAPFTEALQLVLNDLLAEHVEPLQLNNLLEA